MSNNGKACWNQNPDTNNNQRKTYRRITTNQPSTVLKSTPSIWSILRWAFNDLFLFVLVSSCLFDKNDFVRLIPNHRAAAAVENHTEDTSADCVCLFFGDFFFLLFHVISDPGTVRFLLTFMYSVTFSVFPPSVGRTSFYRQIFYLCWYNLWNAAAFLRCKSHILSKMNWGKYAK